MRTTLAAFLAATVLAAAPAGPGTTALAGNGGERTASRMSEQEREAYMAQFSHRMERKGSEIGTYAERTDPQARVELSEAWEAATRAWTRLQAAGEETWREARREFEENWLALQHAWATREPALPSETSDGP